MHLCPINWQAVEAVGVWIAALAAVGAFVAAGLALRSSVSQARSASAQAEAASRQVEALSRPFVAIACSSTMPTDLIEWMTDVIPTEIAEGNATLVNAGVGPALNLTWSYERAPDRVIRGSCAFLKAGGVFRFDFPVELGVGPKQIICEYSSANGVRYRSIITLNGRMVVKCDVEVVR
jgi:F0F1-type ATP synthase membrane subunit c/vacuolar-type H+-ATPase subunit K